jgi:predicted peptidase
MLKRLRLEFLLILSLLLLVGQLTWPSVSAWWQRPRPGHVGVDRYEGAGLAPEYLMYLPSEYQTGLWPLVVFLHGSGKRGCDPSALRGQGPFAIVQKETLPAILVAPQCQPDNQWQPDSVVAFIEQVASFYNVDRERIYLVGYSMGGYGTWHTAAVQPELFAAIVPICGGGEPDDARSLAEIPIWAFHGAEDQVVPLAQSERMIEAIRTAGGEPKLTVIPDASHGICDDVCIRSDLWGWLLEQRRCGHRQR